MHQGARCILGVCSFIKHSRWFSGLALTPCGLANAGLGYDPYTTNYHVTRPNSALQASVRAGPLI